MGGMLQTRYHCSEVYIINHAYGGNVTDMLSLL